MLKIRLRVSNYEFCTSYNGKMERYLSELKFLQTRFIFIELQNVANEREFPLQLGTHYHVIMLEDDLRWRHYGMMKFLLPTGSWEVYKRVVCLSVRP